MTESSGPSRPSFSPAAEPAAPDQGRGTILLSAGEFLWLTLGVWVGGIFILTLLPVLLIPRLGMPLGVVASYLVFFLTWQPIQIVTQRTFGMRAGVIRMVLFVGGAATFAFYLREALLALSRG
jgi:hypothetical protein